MAVCQECINSCCFRPCIEELFCLTECCGCCDTPILLIENITINPGEILGQRSSDLRYGPFDPLAVNGLQKPKVIARYHATSDSNGDVIPRYYSSIIPNLQCGQKYTNGYYCGTFRIQDLIGDVQSAESAHFLRIVDGNAGGSGIVKLT